MRSRPLALAACALTALAAATPAAAADTARSVEVQILGLNDLHGNLEPPAKVDGRSVGGVAYLGSHLDAARADNPNGTITVHAGDVVGASPLISSWFHDEPTILATNLMRFDVGTLGNHEFDEGGPEMLRLIKGGHRTDGKQVKNGEDTSDPQFPGAAYPYISANVVDARTGKPILPPTAIVKRKGVKVGFIGVTTLETPQIVVPDAVAPFRFLDISDTVNRYAAQLQRKKVNAIVVVAHAGGEQTSAHEAVGEIFAEAAQMAPSVDAIVAGHSHSLINTTVAGKLIVEGYRYGTAFDQMTLRISRRTGDVVEKSATIVPAWNDAVRPDAELEGLVQRFKDRITPLSSQVVGTTTGAVTRSATAAGESALGDLIADAQRTVMGTDIALMNPGGIRADLAAGDLTFGALFSVQPFDNGMVTTTLTGARIRQALEQQFSGTPPKILQVSGLTWRRAGSTVEDVMVGDQPLDDTRSYTVAMNSFLATGGDGFSALAGGTGTTSNGSDLDALVAYVKGLPQPFTAPDPRTTPRITGG